MGWCLRAVLETDDETPLNRIRRPPGPPSPRNLKDVLDRLNFVRSLGLPEDAGNAVHHNRLSRIAGEGAKTTPQHLRRFDPLRRRATLVAFLSERSAELGSEYCWNGFTSIRPSYIWVCPPSTTKSAAATKLLSSEARKAMARAISSVSPSRPSGIVGTTESRSSSETPASP